MGQNNASHAPVTDPPLYNFLDKAHMKQGASMNSKWRAQIRLVLDVLVTSGLGITAVWLIRDVL
jgi:hypothetical protein